MSQIDDVKREAARGKTAQALDQELDNELAARPPAAPEALTGALILLGDEIARMEVLAERAGDEAAAQRLAVGLGMPAYIEGVLAGDDGMLNDLLLTPRTSATNSTRCRARRASTTPGRSTPVAPTASPTPPRP